MKKFLLIFLILLLGVVPVSAFPPVAPGGGGGSGTLSLTGSCTDGYAVLGTGSSTSVKCGTGAPGGSSIWEMDKIHTNPSAVDDFVVKYVSGARTLSGVKFYCVGGTSATFTLQQCDNDAVSNCANLTSETTVTVASGPATATVTDSSIDADKWLKMLVGTVTGAVTNCTYTIYGTVP